MTNLPVVVKIDTNLEQANGTVVVRTTKDEQIYCTELKLVGNFILLNGARIKRNVHPTVKAEHYMCYGNPEADSVSCYVPVAQVMLKQSDIERTTAMDMSESNSSLLPIWMVRSEEEALKLVNANQEKINKDTIEANTKDLVNSTKDKYAVMLNQAGKAYDQSFWRRWGSKESKDRYWWIGSYMLKETNNIEPHAYAKIAMIEAYEKSNANYDKELFEKLISEWRTAGRQEERKEGIELCKKIQSRKGWVFGI